MSRTIDDNHRLVDLATMAEIPGAVETDDAGVARIKVRGNDGSETTVTRQMPIGSWRVVRRR